MSDPFESPKLLLDRARENTRDLEARIKRFFDRHPYAHIVDSESNPGQEIHKVRLTEKFPTSLSTVAFDISSNLRSALDQAVYGSSIALGASSPWSTKFPFGDDPAGLDADINKGCKHVHPDIVKLLKAFQPYKGGNDALWALNKMRNTKIHRVLIPVGIAGDSVSVAPGGYVFGGFSIGGEIWDPVKNELELCRIGAASQAELNINFTFKVTLGKVPVLEGQPVPDVFDHLTGEVERVVLAIEAETYRIKGGP